MNVLIVIIGSFVTYYVYVACRFAHIFEEHKIKVSFAVWIVSPTVIYLNVFKALIKSGHHKWQFKMLYPAIPLFIFPWMLIVFSNLLFENQLIVKDNFLTFNVFSKMRRLFSSHLDRLFKKNLNAYF